VLVLHCFGLDVSPKYARMATQGTIATC
jgi:hypothetical protein